MSCFFKQTSNSFVTPKVWIWLPISIVVVSLTLFLIQKYYNKYSRILGISQTPVVSKLWNFFVYVVSGEGTLLFKFKFFEVFTRKNIFFLGDWTGWSQLSLRLVQGAWCLAAFVLVNAYCSTLISYLVSPKLMPVAKTYQDLATGYPQNLKLLAEKNEVLALFALVCRFILVKKNNLRISIYIFIFIESNFGSFQRSWRLTSALPRITFH